MPKPLGIIAFAALGFIMFAIRTYLAASYGLLGLFAKALCVCVLLTAMACVAARA